jgi:ATPase family protein associated with various cellular activities (AAA)
LPDSRNAPTQNSRSAEKEKVPFVDLARHRKLLQEFCPSHIPSLELFAFDNFPVFRLAYDDGEPEKFGHLTSTATCYESIEACPSKFHPQQQKQSKDFAKLGTEFAERAINLQLDNWISDGKAEIYCSCRALPYILSKLEKWDPRIDEHLARIFYQLDEDPDRFAIGEAAENKNESDKQKERKSWYKPNAYHTFWTLEILRVLEKFSSQRGYQDSKLVSKANGYREQLRQWARGQLGFQVALHTAKSSVLDSDQLAWSLAIVISRPSDYQSNLSEQDFIRRAFECLFSTQEEVGTWRHYGPLFHYPNAGNAYCYVFETFAALLLHALRPEAEFVRGVLKDHFSSLVRLWRYATTTYTEIKRGEVRGMAWSSGHRSNRALENWATASAFAYAQALRRLLGIWTRETALEGLNYKPTLPIEKARERLVKRCDIWTCSDLAHRLWSMFINPVLYPSSVADDDPDEPVLGGDSPCSAILFGPPGTSKTSLVSAIAGAIGWKYVELHPSHFVAEGLPSVQSTADMIFGKLMELDRTVVLFDEIDELVRERAIEPDQFGRFLTTSMLPRLAELWKGRKIMYFVATNHIEYFDSAVTRSERFDAIVFVSPPSLDVKRNEILRLLKDVYGLSVTFASHITKHNVEAAMPMTRCEAAEKARKREDRERIRAGVLPNSSALAKLALLRWDELNELALHLASELDGRGANTGKGVRTITQAALKNALLQIRDSKSRSLNEYCRFVRDPLQYERFDASRTASWVVNDGEGINKNAPFPSSVRKINGRYIVYAPVGPITNLKIPGFTVGKMSTSGGSNPGEVTLTMKKNPMKPATKKPYSKSHPTK